jgi:ankyrin repeat protein
MIFIITLLISNCTNINLNYEKKLTNMTDTELVSLDKNTLSELIEKEIKQNGVNGVNHKYPNLLDGTMLSKAVELGNEHAISELMIKGADPKIADLFRDNPITLTARKGNIRIMKLLLTDQTAVKDNNNNSTPLSIESKSSSNNNISIANNNKLLEIDSKPSLNNDNNNNISTFNNNRSLEIDSKTLVNNNKKYLSKEINPDFSDFFADIKPQNVFSYNGQLTEKRERLNARDRDGNNALIIAVKERHTDLVEYLLEEGSNPDSKSGSIYIKKTALEIAVEAMDIPTMKVLIKYGANVNITSGYGNETIPDMFTKSISKFWKEFTKSKYFNPNSQKSDIMSAFLGYIKEVN